MFALQSLIMKKSLGLIIGFLSFVTGMLSVILYMLGLKFTFLNIIYGHGVFTLVIHIIMIFGGVALVYFSLAPSELDPEEDENQVD